MSCDCKTEDKKRFEFTNIVGKKEYFENFDFVFKKMCECISMTLGPSGGYTMVTNVHAETPISPSKDGYSIILEIKFSDQKKLFIAEFIKDISKHMNREVGDSTTSCIVIAYNLFSKLIDYDLMEKHPSFGCILPPTSIKELLNSIGFVLIDNYYKKKNDLVLKVEDRSVQDELLKKVSRISSNNNNMIGDTVSDLFIKRKSDKVYINTDLSRDHITSIEKEVGFEFGSGLIHESMINQDDGISCEYENPRYLLVKGPLAAPDVEKLEFIIDYCNDELKSPIVIVAREYTQEVMHMIIKKCKSSQKLNHETKEIDTFNGKPILCLMIDTTAHEKSRDRLEDLRVVLGCDILQTQQGAILDLRERPELVEKFLGKSESIHSTKLSTRIKNGYGNKDVIQARIERLEAKIHDIEIGYDAGVLSLNKISDIKKRIAMLNSDMTTIKIGGATDKDRRAIKLIYDDAICACECAIENGFALGGNVTIPYMIDNLNNVGIVNEVYNHIKETGKTIVVGNDPVKVKAIVSDMIEIVREAFKTSYKKAISNMVGEDTPIYKEIVDGVYNNKDNRVFNLTTGEYESLSKDTNLIVPANTDVELIRSVLGGVGLIVSANQMLTYYPGDAVLVNKEN